MTRYLLDTGIAGDYINRRNGVFDRAQKEVAQGTESVWVCQSSPSCITAWSSAQHATRTFSVFALPCLA